MKNFLLLSFTILLLSCKEKVPNGFTAQNIVDKSLQASGGTLIGNSKITFDFRDKRYKAIRANGQFELMRKFHDSTGTIFDVLTNEHFKRTLDEKVVQVPDAMALRYSASINSVHYFSVLPFGLNDEAVKKEKLKDMSIKDTLYHTIKITFVAKGGGEDFEDVFLYWIHPKTFKLDYFAYSYNEIDGVGMRFREAYNERFLKGIRFVDYNNYKSEIKKSDLLDMPGLFEKGELQLLSKIELNHISVTLL